MRPPALEIDHVTQRFSLRHEKTLRGLFVTKVLRRHATKENFTALDDITADLAAGSTIGLIGHNGSGKSTLLKIIGGVLTPTTGEVRRRGSLAALLELGAGFHHDLTGRENVFLNAEVLGIPRGVARQRFDEIVDFSGVEQFIDTPMKFYSSGMFVRLGFAVAIFAEPDILLVDEVLAVGDEAFQHKCLDVVRRFQEQGRTIVLVTHDMRQVEDFCDRVILLDHGRVVSDGEPRRVIADFRGLFGHAEPRERAVPPVTVSDIEVEAVATGSTTDVRVVAGFSGHSTSFQPRVEVLSGSGGLLYAVTGTDIGLATEIDGSRRLRVELPNLPLSGGEYRVVVSACDVASGRVWHTDGTGRLVLPRDAGHAPLTTPARGRELP
jgi:ABC-2 type transport system ATP-binding protein